MPLKIFIDSDVVISSLISTSGAAHLLLKHPDIIPVISNISHREIEIVAERLHLDKNKLRILFRKKFKEVQLEKGIKELKNKYGDYTFDISDTHIVAGAKKAKVRFLISYNMRHFQVEKIRKELNIFLMTPGVFLQYLRSLV